MSKNIILCLTTGRSGTNLLQELLALTEDTCSEHEPEPAFQNVIEEVRRDPEAAIAFVRNIKLPAILDRPQVNYAETSHLFGKGFFEAFVVLQIPFRLVILNRHPRQVAKSYWRLQTVPGRTPGGNKFLFHPEQAGVLTLPNWQNMSDYQLCFWSCLEVECRKSAYTQQCKARGIPVVEISMEELKDWKRFQLLCQQLGLTLPIEAVEAHRRITAEKVNHKAQHRPRFNFSRFPQQETRLWQALGERGRVLKAEVEARYHTIEPQPSGGLLDIVPLEDSMLLLRRLWRELSTSSNKLEALQRIGCKGRGFIRSGSPAEK